MSFELEGVDDFLRNMQRVGKRVEKVAPKALAAGAEIIRKEMEAGAPYDATTRNLAKKHSAGKHLKDNIVVSPVHRDENNREYVSVGPSKGAKDEFFYAKFPELGTVNMAAQPFMEPAFLTKRKECLSAIADVVREEVEKGV